MNMDQNYIPSTEGISIGEHTADLWLEFEGASLEECIKRAVHGLYSVMAKEFSLTGDVEVEDTLKIDSTDMMIVDVLNEALFLFDAESTIILDPVIALQTKHEVTLTFKKVKCEIPLGKAGMEVKAATFHGMELIEVNGKWIGKILLDL
jgi:SHS2 domain-containing protein